MLNVKFGPNVNAEIGIEGIENRVDHLEMEVRELKKLIGMGMLGGGLVSDSDAILSDIYNILSDKTYLASTKVDMALKILKNRLREG